MSRTRTSGRSDSMRSSPSRAVLAQTTVVPLPLQLALVERAQALLVVHDQHLGHGASPPASWLHLFRASGKRRSTMGRGSSASFPTSTPSPSTRRAWLRPPRAPPSSARAASRWRFREDGRRRRSMRGSSRKSSPGRRPRSCSATSAACRRITPTATTAWSGRRSSIGCPDPPAAVLRMEGERAPEEAASRYARAMREVFPAAAFPRIDLVTPGHGRRRPHRLPVPRHGGAGRAGAVGVRQSRPAARRLAADPDLSRAAIRGRGAVPDRGGGQGPVFAEAFGGLPHPEPYPCERARPRDGVAHRARRSRRSVRDYPSHSRSRAVTVSRA